MYGDLSLITPAALAASFCHLIRSNLLIIGIGLIAVVACSMVGGWIVKRHPGWVNRVILGFIAFGLGSWFGFGVHANDLQSTDPTASTNLKWNLIVSAVVGAFFYILGDELLKASASRKVRRQAAKGRHPSSRSKRSTVSPEDHTLISRSRYLNAFDAFVDEYNRPPTDELELMVFMEKHSGIGR